MRSDHSPAKAESTAPKGGGGQQPRAPRKHISEPPQYSCPMHSEVVQSTPGSCPKCGMELVPRDLTATHQSGAHQEDDSGHKAASAEQYKDHATDRPYLRLTLMAALSFLAMFALMYAMVNALENVFINVNQFYMAGLMAAPMVIIELLLMKSMYRNKRLNAAILAGSAIAMAGFWILVRQQTLVSDKQFLRSMIPHHAGAILMCEKAPVSDPEIKRLCESIKRSQQAEIDWMKAKLTQRSKE